MELYFVNPKYLQETHLLNFMVMTCNDYILVGGLEHFLFSIIYGIILPIDYSIYIIFFRGVETTNQIVSGEALPLNPGKDLWLILGSPRGRLRNALSRALREFEAEKPLSAMEIYGILEGLMGGSTWTAGSKVCLKEPNRNGILNMIWKIRP